MDSGDHLLSQAAARQVPSTAQVLTVVFGMGTGVSPERIITGNFLFFDNFRYPYEDSHLQNRTQIY